MDRRRRWEALPVPWSRRAAERAWARRAPGERDEPPRRGRRLVRGRARQHDEATKILPKRAQSRALWADGYTVNEVAEQLVHGIRGLDECKMAGARNSSRLAARYPGR